MRGEPYSLTLARGASRVLALLDEMEEQLSTDGARYAKALSETACSMSASCRLSAVLQTGSSQAGTWAAIVSPDKGPAVLAAMMICAYSVKPSVARVRRGLKEAKRILGELGDPEGETLSQNEIRELLKHLSQWDVHKVITSWFPMTVIHLDHSHCQFNSVYMAGINAILVTGHRRDLEKCSMQYVFLHEVGHALHMALTKNPAAVPASFEAILPGVLGADPTAIRAKYWPDLFADAFAVALSYKNHLANSNPFCKAFRDSDQAALAEYFRLLISAVLEAKDRLHDEALDMEWTDARKSRFIGTVEQTSLNSPQVLPSDSRGQP